jgi:hypothetical protein
VAGILTLQRLEWVFQQPAKPFFLGEYPNIGGGHLRLTGYVGGRMGILVACSSLGEFFT